jgi:hypothetical protein
VLPTIESIAGPSPPIAPLFDDVEVTGDHDWHPARCFDGGVVRGSGPVARVVAQGQRHRGAGQDR